jgi:hypothetical protein
MTDGRLTVPKKVIQLQERRCYVLKDIGLRVRIVGGANESVEGAQEYSVSPNSNSEEMKQRQCICPLSWSVHCNFTDEGKCSERGWACTPHPYQPGPILPSSLNVRQKAAVATLCTLWSVHKLA